MKLRLAMIGGGQGAFIGAIHRMAAALDGLYELIPSRHRPSVAI